LIWAVTTPLGIPKPLELTSDAELAVKFNIKPAELAPEPAAAEKADKDPGGKDTGAKDKKEQGGGLKARGPAGKLGQKGPEKKNEQQGDPGPNLGGMAEVLSSDVGDEVKK